MDEREHRELSNISDLLSTLLANLKVHVQVLGVVTPSWLAAVFGSALVLSAIGFILALFLLRELTREIRVLQIHTRDIETVLIREGMAVERDFPPWTEQAPREPASLTDDRNDRHNAAGPNATGSSTAGPSNLKSNLKPNSK